jgi:hypothetical protein
MLKFHFFLFLFQSTFFLILFQTFPPHFPFSFPLQISQLVVYSTTFLYYSHPFYPSAIPDNTTLLQKQLKYSSIL